MKNAALDELLEEGYEQKDEGFMRLLSVYWRKKSDNTFRSLLLSAYKEVRNRADYREYLQESGKYDEETFEKEHGGMAHGGFVIRSGRTGKDASTNHIIEYSLRLGSNPEFTASVLVAYARAVYKMAKEGQSGCKTVFDVAPGYLSPKSAEQLRKDLL